MTPILLDAHVHFHCEHDAGTLLDAAALNFRRTADSLSCSSYLAVVCFVDYGSGPGLPGLIEIVRSGRAPGWKVLKNAEETSVRFVRDQEMLIAIHGRQYVSAEKLEVLALGDIQRPLPMMNARDVILACHQRGALPVLPWGVGKWLGARGRLVEALSADPELRTLFIGDNGNRPRVWPSQRLNHLQKQLGKPLISGTDPLPLQGEERRVGSFGTKCEAEIDPLSPCATLMEQLNEGVDWSPYGCAAVGTTFLRTQIHMQRWKQAK